jgi:thiamine-monophosphate kinase
MKLRDLGEFGLIERIKQVVASDSPDVLIGIDDDAAVVRVGRSTLVVTTDAFVEGVHFRFDYFSPFELGWRLMAANLSDLAAMGARPLFAVVDLAVPADADAEEVTDLYYGMREIGARFGVRIVGGDTTSSPGRWFLAVTLLGAADGGRYALRSRARVGDVIAVTGWLGSSRAGLELLTAGGGRHRAEPVLEAHLRPVPRVWEGRFLVQRAGVRAMIDVSDGLSSEVNHLCRLSGVGAVIEAARLPIRHVVRELALSSGHDPFDYALHGGEDFELLFTIPPEKWADLSKRWTRHFEIPLTAIGRIVRPERGIVLLTEQGERELLPGGWQHFRSNTDAPDACELRPGERP